MSLTQLDNSWKSAVKITLPIFMGYFAAGIAYGMLATAAGMPAWFTIGMCFIVFSGTAQYAAIPFFVALENLFSVFLSTLLMSLRFVFYHIGMREYFPENRPTRLLGLAYLTDENFALLSTFSPEHRKAMFFKVSVLGMLYWTFATIIGVLLGDSVAGFIPHLDFALPCLFAILGYEQYKTGKQWKSLVIGAISFMLASFITQKSLLLVSIIIAIILVLLLPNHLSDTDKKLMERKKMNGDRK